MVITIWAGVGTLSRVIRPGCSVMVKTATADVNAQLATNAIAVNPKFAMVRALSADLRGNSGTTISTAPISAMTVSMVMTLVTHSPPLTTSPVSRRY